MNEDTLKGQWTQLKGKVREQWGKLTDDDLDRIEGQREQLVGQIQQRYGIARDEAERQSRIKDEFLATLGHELRNPLAPLLTTLHLLRLKAGTDRVIAPMADVMERQITHLVRLVDDLLEVSRITRGVIDVQREPVDLVPLLRAAVAPAAVAAKKTVCTITVNSADEKETFRRYLPADQYEFVELVEKGRPDWLASACRQGVRCDALIVSGHHDNEQGFFSDRVEAGEYLNEGEMERVACSDSCPGLFSQLKEVYLFGCNTLNPEPAHPTTGEIPSDLLEEIDQAFSNVQLAFQDAGVKEGWKGVFRVNSYHAEFEKEEVREKVLGRLVENLKKYCPEHAPIWTCVGVAALGLPGMRVEIEAVAVDGK